VGVPARIENAAISFFTCLFSARIWPRVAPGSPSELHTSVRFFVPFLAQRDDETRREAVSHAEARDGDRRPVGNVRDRVLGRGVDLVHRASPEEHFERQPEAPACDEPEAAWPCGKRQ
jgi:hypothetical protein